MLVRDLFEAASTIFGKKGGSTVRKYRCSSGPRKGRIVAKASTCTAPLNAKASKSMKATRSRKGKTIDIKRSRTKRTNPASQRIAKVNKARKIAPRRRSSKRRK